MGSPQGRVRQTGLAESAYGFRVSLECSVKAARDDLERSGIEILELVGISRRQDGEAWLTLKPGAHVR
jgi:hypothetical protein